MSVYQIENCLYLPISKQEAWEFISDPNNLLKITPEKVHFRILNPREEGFYPGQVFAYQLRPLPGYSTQWVSEISHIQEGEYFIDIQLQGPYKLWHHQHHIREVDEGVELRDLVHYSMPFGMLGRLAQALFVKTQLRNTFRYREEKLKSFFGQIPGRPSTLKIQTLKSHV